MRTASRRHDTNQLIVAGLGAAGEAGELADTVKKIVFHHHGFGSDQVDKLIKEAGDVMWYIALLADFLGCSMESIAEANIEKLKKRYPDGFDVERSKHRED